jgi:galactokinase
MGICTLFKQAGYPVGGFDLVIGGNLPLGSGLSSSAALSVAVGMGISEAFGFAVPKKDLARYAQKAEHLFAGVNCGIMDPYASAFGKKGHALLLDCRSQNHQEIPVDLGHHTLLLVNSKVTHALAGTAYNQRRAACEESVQLLRDTFPEIQTLRDLSIAHLERIETLLPASLFPKAKHVISECARVQEAAIALSSGNLTEVGRLLNASHASLSTDFEVSCPELDFLAEQAQALDTVLGARMMGGGFGGCLLTLIKASELNAAKARLEEAYQQKFQRRPDFIEVRLGEGARRS